MTQVILSPTWKLIPENVSWPNINAFTSRALTHPDNGQTFYSAIVEASRHLVDIAEEDWDIIKYYIPGTKCQYATHHEPQNEVYEVTNSNRQEAIEFKDPIITPIQPDTPYTIDAEFEVKEEKTGHRVVVKNEQGFPVDFHEYYQKIARLVKFNRNHDVNKFTVFTHTDSVDYIYVPSQMDQSNDEKIELLKDKFYDWWYNQLYQRAYLPSIFDWILIKIKEKTKPE